MQVRRDRKREKKTMFHLHQVRMTMMKPHQQVVTTTMTMTMRRRTSMEPTPAQHRKEEV
jgi:type IV secretory pathway VirB9-like protein